MSDELNNEWNDLKTAWISGNRRPIDPETFDRLFYSSAIATEAIQLLQKSAVARMMIAQISGRITAASLSDPDRSRVWLAVQDEAGIDDLFASQRTAETAEFRCNFVRAIICSGLNVKGRQWVREKAHGWWSLSDLLEEEREVIVRTLVDDGKTDLAFIRSLGATAEKIYRHLNFNGVRSSRPRLSTGRRRTANRMR